MKFIVSMKDPDALYNAIDPAVAAEVKAMGLDVEETEALAEIRSQKVREACSKWFRYGEYLDVEIDTEAGTCTVVGPR